MPIDLQPENAPRSAQRAVAGAQITGRQTRLKRIFTWFNAALIGALLSAVILRFAGLAEAPPGLNQDEASNAWNAWCLLQTGEDQVGVHWPIFYTRALGENRSTLFLYLLLPFQWLFGLSAWSTRLPVASAGVALVWLAYWLGRHWFDRAVGLTAAWLMALNPWAIQLSRWSNEGCLTAVSVAVPVAAVLWAGLPLPGAVAKARPVRALLAGLLAGLVCYGYPAVRLFLPVFLISFAWLCAPRWIANLRSIRAARATGTSGRGLGLASALWAAGFIALLAPLAYEHVFHADEIARRAAARWIWDAQDGWSTRVAKAAARYPAHFGPDFLFWQGDHYEVAWTGGFGIFPPYTAVLLLVGALVLLTSLRSNAAARMLLLWILLYPLADCLHTHMSSHALRAAPGLTPLVLLAALGLIEGFRFLRRQSTFSLRLAAAVALAGLALQQHADFLYHYFVTRNHESPIRHGYHADLMRACAVIRPYWHEYDAIVVTPTDMTHPYVIMMVGLQYDARRWFAEPRATGTFHEWDIYRRVGRFRFPIDSVEAELDRLRHADFQGRILVIARPGECGHGSVRDVVRGHSGDVELEIREPALRGNDGATEMKQD